MKRLIPAVFAVILISAGLSAQNFYFRAGLGYAFPHAGQTMYDAWYGLSAGYSGSRNNNGSTQVYNLSSASFSAGTTGFAGFGYMFNNHVGAQLDFTFSMGLRTYTFNDMNVTFGSGSSTYPGNISTSQQAKTFLLLSPQLVLQTGGDKINGYTRFGIALPVSSKIDQVTTMSNSPGTGAVTIDEFSWEIKNKMSIGFTATAGVKYKINDRVSIFGELSMLSLTLNPKEQKLTSLTENGQPIDLSSYPYATTITISKTAVTDSLLSQLPAYSQPFSNVGINIGVTFNLGEGHSRSAGRDHNDVPDRNRSNRPRPSKFN